MKTKNILYLSSIIFICLFSSVSANQATSDKDFDFEELFQNETPLEFSIKSMREYFKNIEIFSQNLKNRQNTSDSKTSYFNNAFMGYIKDVYNKQGYGQALSQDGSHVIEFLELSNELNLDSTTVYVCLRLFHNKIKSVECELVDDTVALQLLQHSPPLLERFFNTQLRNGIAYSLDFLRRHTEDIMLNAFIDKLPEFQSDPGNFISSLAKNVTQLVKKELNKIENQKKKTLNEKEATERLRNTIIRFFETILNKLVWNISSHEGIWNSFINIANSLQLLGRYSIIDHMDDLDDLLWSLVHRFSWFLEFAGHALPLEFYDEVENDLVNKVVFFLEAQEQDEGIKTKKETLFESLVNAKTKAIAQQQGLTITY